jgi:hypothetical protein
MQDIVHKECVAGSPRQQKGSAAYIARTKSSYAGLRIFPERLFGCRRPLPPASFPDVQLHFVGAPFGAGPESIRLIVVMDSGLALRAPRNDGADVNSASPWLLGVARQTASSSNP